MGTAVYLELEAASRPRALEASEAVLRSLRHSEQRLSTWIDDSELAALNRQPAGRELTLSPRLAQELQQVQGCWSRTGGAFDPGIGRLLQLWDVRGAGRIPSDPEIRQALRPAGLGSLRLEADRATRLDPDLVLEEGAFGKGAGLARVQQELPQGWPEVDGLIDFGGQLLLLGPSAKRIGIAHPRHRGQVILELELTAGSVATSGNSERALAVDGRPFSHILDPRSGRPVPDFGSLTVIAVDPLWADCLSTGLYVLGPEAALSLGQALSDVEVLVVEAVADGGLRVRATAGLEGRLHSLTPGLEMHFSAPPLALPVDPVPPTQASVPPSTTPSAVTVR
jgi:thiamine biosynthesis lipoprotein